MLTRDRRIARILLVGLIACMFAVTPMPAIADERGAEGLSDGGASDVESNAFATPPTGYTVTYFFPGATANLTNTIATSVHCTNITTISTPIRVEFYSFAGGLLGTGIFTIAAHRSATVSGSGSGLTALYFEDVNVALSGPLNQGAVRVLKKGTGKIICTAQVLDAVSSPPAFVVPLPSFGPTGLH
jgi:hypothetical protein